MKDPCVSVKCILRSPDGALFGVAYSKHIIQLYAYFGGNEIHQHLEIDAHAGSVNDLAFCNPTMQLCAITCGDDKAIKVWKAATGSKLCTFEGHDAPVHYVCTHNKQNVHAVYQKLGFANDTKIYLIESKWDSSLGDLKDIFPKTYIKDGIIPADKKSKYLDSELVIESCLEPLLVHF